MKIIAGNNTYTRFKSLSFDIENDLVNQEIPINQFEAKIVTTDTFRIGDIVELRDDDNNIWARYVVKESEKEKDNIVYLLAQSFLAEMEKVILPSDFLGGIVGAWDCQQVISYLFNKINSKYNETLQEYKLFTAPVVTAAATKNQSARRKLQEFCFIYGIFVQTFFCEKVELWNINNVAQGRALHYIRPEQIYTTSVIKKDNKLDKISVERFNQEALIDSRRDIDTTYQWLEENNKIDGGTCYYVYTSGYDELRLSNTDEIQERQYSDNRFCAKYSIARNFLENYIAPYCNNTLYYLQLDVLFKIDEFVGLDFLPGRRCNVELRNKLYQGYIASERFTFGRKYVKVRMIIKNVQEYSATEQTLVTINCQWFDEIVGDEVIIAQIKKRYARDGYDIIYFNYFDIVKHSHRYILYPAQTSLYIPASEFTAEEQIYTVDYSTAIDVDLNAEKAWIYAVDSTNLENEVLTIE